MIFKDVKNIIFDFDGVILDSMLIRSRGFEMIFSDFDKNLVNELVEFNINNGGLSRFVKIKYFFNELLNEDISEGKINEYALKYSKFMKENLLNRELLIKETIDFIAKNYNTMNFTVASGSEQNELRYINESLQLSKYFKLILGSPKPKIENVRDIIDSLNYEKNETILIGDSINDFDAAKANGIRFFGYNNSNLEKISDFYIRSFKNHV